MQRIGKDDYFSALAILIASRSNCIRRRVGCVLVSNKGDIIGTGYNGTARGQANCIDNPCAGANYPSGEGLDMCEAIHAETNALMQCHNVYEINTCYTTVTPCIHCVKALLNTSCKRIVFLDFYPHKDSQRLWKKADRPWTHYSMDKISLDLLEMTVGKYTLTMTRET